MIRSVVIRLVLATIWPGRRPCCSVFLREHSARVHLLLSFIVNRRCKCRVAIYHIHLEGQGRLVCGNGLTSLFALHYDGLFLNVYDVNRVDSFRLVRDSFDVLRRNNCHGLDYANLLLLFRDALTVDFLLLGRGRSWMGYCSRGLLDDALTAALRFVIESTISWARIHYCLLGLLILLRRATLNGSWRVALRSLCRFIRYRDLCRRVAVLSRGRRRPFLSPAQKLLNVLIVLLSEHASTLLPFEKKIIGRRDVVKSVPLNFLLCLRCLYTVIFDEHADNLWIDGDRLIAKINRRSVGRLVLMDSVPRVVPDVLNREALRRVRIQNVADEVLCLLRQETWHLVVCLDNLLVQLLGVLVFEG